MTYDAHAILQSLDNNVIAFMAIGSVAMIFNYIYFAGAALAAKRDKVFTFPLICSTVWFAHDLNFVLSFHDWFNVYDHWYLKLFWLALVPTTLWELYYVYQTWKYGKKEYMPNASDRLYTLFILGALAMGMIGWWSLKQFLADPIYAYTFGSTGFLAPPLVLARVLQRGNAQGQSTLTWVAYVCMQIAWFSAVLIFFGDTFHQPPYLAMVAGSIVCGMVLAYTVYRMNQRKQA